MKQCKIDEVHYQLVQGDAPTWRPISSRKLAQLLGVSLQSLANWRVRGTGPDFEPVTKGKGNRTFYRPDVVLAWLSTGSKQPWEFSRDWLLAHGLEIDGVMDQQATRWLIENVDDVL